MTDLTQAHCSELEFTIETELQIALNDLADARYDMDAERVLRVGEEITRLGNRISIGAQTVIADAYWKDHG